MRKYGLIGALLALAVTASIFAQDPALKNDPQTASADADYASKLAGTVRLRLQKRLQLKDLRVGAPVTAKLMQDIKVQGRMVVPKNTQFEGRVVEWTPQEAGDGVARLAFVFERAVLKSGQPMPLYGMLSGLLIPQSEGSDGVAALQDTKLRRMELESRTSNTAGGEPGGRPRTETDIVLRELYETATRSRPTAASQHYNCREEQGWLWCGPAGNSLAAPPVGISGLPGVFLQTENTPQGPLGVLVSKKDNFSLNAGIDLMVRLVPRS